MEKYSKSNSNVSIFDISFERRDGVVYIDGSLIGTPEYRKVFNYLKDVAAKGGLTVYYNPRSKEYEIDDKNNTFDESILVGHLKRKIFENNVILTTKNTLDNAKMNLEDAATIKQLYREHVIANILFYNKSNFEEYENFIKNVKYGNKEPMIEYLNELRDVTKDLESIGYMTKKADNLSVITSLSYKKVLQANIKADNATLAELDPNKMFSVQEMIKTPPKQEENKKQQRNR